MSDLRPIPRAEIEAIRGDRDCALRDRDLWAEGSLEGLRRPTVAIVGTRAATAYGRRLARAFARDLGRAGCCVVSGLALGIDAEAHEGCLDVDAPTVGVLGSGHARFFPKRNADLAKRIVARGGAVLSPFPPDRPAYPSQFLQRNGVVAALADAVVVIEAPARSGALNTASWAADRVPVFAVPGDVDRVHVAGCHDLIRDGATLARGAADILEVLGRQLLPELVVSSVCKISDDLGKALVKLLATGEADLESLVAAGGARPPQTLARLARLELDGVVTRNGAFFALADLSAIVGTCSTG